jgi:hypothetical protein
VSHRHYCPDEATCRDRDPCCLFTEGDCLCDHENQCRGATPPHYAVVPGVGVARAPDRTAPAPRTRTQPRRKKPRSQRRSGIAD